MYNFEFNILALYESKSEYYHGQHVGFAGDGEGGKSAE